MKHHTINRHYRACPDNLDPRIKSKDDKGLVESIVTTNDNIKGRQHNIMPRLFSVILNHLANVILGFIPRIHAKHTPMDPRVEPEDDNKRRMFFKPENDYKDLLPQCAPDATGFLSDVYKKSTRAQKFLADGVQCGRSMIEMLGVLAIIGILSIGGIQGFSKAMREYRSNQQKQQLSQIFANTISLRSSIGSYPETMENITYVLDALNEIPDGLTYKNSRLIDNYGNLIMLKHGLSKWTNKDGSQSHQYYYMLSLDFSQTNTLLSPSGEDFCKNALQTIKAFRADISAVCFHISDSTTWNGGASYCPSGQQLTDDVSSLVKVQQTCQFCNKTEKGCLFNIVFDMSN